MGSVKCNVVHCKVCMDALKRGAERERKEVRDMGVEIDLEI